MEDFKGWFSNFLTRLASAVFLVLAMVLLLWWGDIPFLAGMTAIIGVGLWEFYHTLSENGYSPAAFLAIPMGVSLPVISFFIEDTPQDLAPLAAVLCGLLVLTFAWFIFRPGQPHAVASIALTFTGVFLVSFTLSHFILMLRFDEVHWTAPFTLIVMIWVYDAAAYLAGSALGRHKMSPRISPNKSWEGLIGATLATFAAAPVLKATVSRDWLSWGVAFTLAAMVAVLAPLGDLSESLVKRELEVKDMSELIPGHGGILDRFDSMLFVAPAAYYYLRLIIKP